MISISIVTAAVFCFFYYFCTRTFSYWRDKKVAGPKPIPFFGNLKDSALRRKHVGIVYKEIYDQFPKEDIIGIYRMTNPAIIVRNLDVAKNILIKDFDVFPERGVEFSKERLGNNLFHCDVTAWKALRSRLTPLFTTVKLKNSIPIFDKYANQMMKYLDTITTKNKEQEMHDVFLKYTMASNMAVSYSMDVDFFEKNQAMIEKAGCTIFTSTYAAEIDMLIPNIWRKIHLSLYPKIVNKFCYEVVHAVKIQNNEIPTVRSDLINTLLTIKNTHKIDADVKGTIEITDHVIAGQVFIFFAAGFGNNALSLSYALFQLAKHQDCQEKLIQEIDEVMTKYEGQLDYEAFKEMPYLEKVFLEILRMNPLTNSIQRSAKRDYTIPGTDIVIEEGTTVLVSPYAVHRDPDIYPDPDNFDPERFSPENLENRHSCAFLPFGVGPRSCLGRQMGKLQFFAAMIRVFSKYRVEPSDKTKKIEDYDPMSTLLATKGGVYVKFTSRKIRSY